MIYETFCIFRQRNPIFRRSLRLCSGSQCSNSPSHAGSQRQQVGKHRRLGPPFLEKPFHCESYPSFFLCFFYIAVFFFQQAANTLTSTKGVGKLTSLTTIHLRDNQIENLDGFAEEMASLQYMNLRSNNLQNLKELKKLQCLPNLRAISLAGEFSNSRISICFLFRFFALVRSFICSMEVLY